MNISFLTLLNKLYNNFNVRNVNKMQTSGKKYELKILCVYITLLLLFWMLIFMQNVVYKHFDIKSY